MTDDLSVWIKLAKRQIALEAAYDIIGWLLIWAVLMGAMYVLLHLATK